MAYSLSIYQLLATICIMYELHAKQITGEREWLLLFPNFRFASINIFELGLIYRLEMCLSIRIRNIIISNKDI